VIIADLAMVLIKKAKENPLIALHAQLLLIRELFFYIQSQCHKGLVWENVRAAYEIWPKMQIQPFNTTAKSRVFYNAHYFHSKISWHQLNAEFH